MTFNGGRSQVNLNFIGGATGEYPFLNLMLTGGGWFFANNANAPVTPDLLDANGWPNVFTGTNPSGGYASVCVGPSQTERPGNYVLTWTGNGTLFLNFTHTTVSGSLTGSGGSGRYVFSTTSTGNFDVRITTAGVTNLQLFHVDDEAALLAGQVFGTKFLSRLREANFGVIRFLNWINSNNSNLTTWATRKPTTYYSYGAGQLPVSIYGGVTTNSGSDYSCSTPSGGFTIADKAMVSVVFNASCPTQQAAAFTNGSANVTVTGHGQATGNQAYLQTTGTLPTNFSPNVSYFVTVIDANTLNYATTSGGTAIVAGSAGSGTHTSFPNPTLAVGVAAATQLLTKFSGLFPQNVNYPVGGSSSSFGTMVYDATLQSLITFGGSSGQGSSGINNGAPPEICLSLCAAVGAHPYFSIPCLACDPATDFLPSLATFIQSTYPWMVPRFEPPNELWQFVNVVDTYYANAKAAAYGWGTGGSQYMDWYGKALSILGQQAAAVYGSGNLGTAYHMLCGVQTQTTQSASNARLASTKFLSSDPNPVQSPYTRTAASGWTSHVAVANYFSPLERFTVQELIDAYSYSVTNAGNSAAQTTLANSYADTLLGTASSFNLANNKAAFVAWKAWGAGFGVNKICGYEGGYSPDYLSGNWATGITGATRANPCVLTLAATSSNSEKSGMAGNPAVVGMSVTPSSIVGMTQLNGNTYTVTAVSGNQVTINVDSSAFTAYSSGGTLTYVNSQTYSNALRLAGKNAPHMLNYLTTNYNDFLAAGGEFPSCFQFGGPSPSTNAWSVLEDIYQTPNPPQWEAIRLFNTNKRRLVITT